MTKAAGFCVFCFGGLMMMSMASAREAAVSQGGTPLERCICISGEDRAESDTALRRYADYRKAKVPAELHVTPARELWATVRAEFSRQLNLDGRRGRESSCLLADTLPDTLRVDSQRIWPAGKMPNVSTNQLYAPTLEWFVPRYPKTKAIQVVFPGGGYVGLSYKEEGLTVGTRLNALGLPAVVVRYRTPRPLAGPKHLSAWQDAQRALRIVRSQAASRGLDPDRIGVMGFSAGGHLALLCATSSTRAAYPRIDATDDVPCNVQWACPVYPAYVLSDGADSVNAKGGNDDDCTLMPEFAFDGQTPPMMFQHGDADGFAAMGSVKAWAHLNKKGIPAELHTLATRGHCFYFSAAPGTGSAACFDRIVDFLRRRMPEAFAAEGRVVRVAPGAGALLRAQESVRASLAKAPREPVTVVLGPGEYRLEETLAFGPADSGCAEAPVVWRGEGNAVVRGGVDVGPWEDEGDGVVSAAIPEGADGKPLVFDMLFVNGTRAERSVLPKNRGSFRIPGGKEDSWTDVISAATNDLKVGAHTRVNVVYAREYTRLGEDAAKILDAVPADELGEVQLQVRLDWSQARRRIVGWDREKRLLETECFGNPVRHGQYRWCDRSMIRFENLRQGFTDGGDWLYDAKNGKILYRLRAGETAAALRASAPARRLSRLLTAKGAHDIRFENLAFEFADSPQAAGDDPARHTQVWQGQSARSSDASVCLESCTDVAFVGCRVARSGNYGFRIGTGCRRVTLARCETWDTGAGGVWMGADAIYPPREKLERRIIREMYPESCASNVIADCVFRRGGRFHPEGTAVFVTYASDNLITHNEIDDFYYSGITLGYIWGYRGSPTQRNAVSFNRISNIGQGELFDLSGIYALSASYGTVISNNVVTKVGGHGIYMDEGSEGILIENNLVTHVEEAGAFMHFGSGCTFRNNIFAYNSKGGLAWASKREAFLVPSSVNFLGNVFFTEDAPLIGPRTLGVDGVRAHNVWWNPKGAGDGDFDGLSAGDYLKNGRAYGDVVADPLFVDPGKGDFRLRSESPALKLGFRPFDTAWAGPRPLTGGKGCR